MLNKVSIAQKKVLNGEKVEYPLGKKALKILKKRNKKRLPKKEKVLLGEKRQEFINIKYSRKQIKYSK